MCLLISEATMYVLSMPFKEIQPTERPLPAGRAIANAHLHILDSHLQAVPLGKASGAHDAVPSLQLSVVPFKRDAGWQNRWKPAVQPGHSFCKLKADVPMYSMCFLQYSRTKYRIHHTSGAPDAHFCLLHVGKWWLPGEWCQPRSCAACNAIVSCLKLCQLSV